MLRRILKLSHGIRKLDHLREHLQTAIELEHSTIPPYLCALYSIKEGRNLEAAGVIKSVVMEEMLHMALAANVLNAIGGQPRLNHAKFIPRYPATLPHSDGRFKVRLQKFSPKAIKTFLQIERPAKPKARPQAEHYQTIGQFYAAIRDALRRLCSGREHFTGDRARQITPEYFYGGGGELHPVDDCQSACAALEVIVDQGEGIHHTLSDGDNELANQREEFAHYFRFREISLGRYYRPGTDTPSSGPTGKDFAVDWDAVYNMRPNPRAKDYQANPELRKLNDDFNRTYTGLLDLLHRSFNGQPKLLLESVGAMYELKYKALALMRVPCGDGDMTAGPSFEYASLER